MLRSLIEAVFDEVDCLSGISMATCGHVLGVMQEELGQPVLSLVCRLQMGGEILGIAGPMDRRLNAAARTSAFRLRPS